MKITGLKGREILDSRGTPTVEAEVTLENGIVARASVPSGASTGENEAIELRDNEPSRYNGKGVRCAIGHINRRIAPSIIGLDATKQRVIDAALIALDGTNNKRKLGANATLAVSLATARAAAKASGLPLYRYIGGTNTHILPIPMINIVNGGRHSNAPIAFQEFMIRPIGAKSLHEAIRVGAEVFQSLKQVIRKRGLSTAVGDEGGFAPHFSGIEDVLDSITTAIEEAAYKPGKEVSIAIDCAASEFYSRGEYDYSLFQPGGKILTPSQQIDYLAYLIDSYPIDSIEDGMSQNDWEGWNRLTARLERRCQLVGDDLFVTNTRYLRQGIEQHCANAILIKPNQIGTLSETLDTIELAKRNGYATIISHRSGETEDTTIADIAVATNAGQIKTGSMSRGERTAKYNRLIRIEEELQGHSRYPIDSHISALLEFDDEPTE